jgi:hypothetical protein
MKLHQKLTYSNVMSTIAVFGVLAGGTAIAADKITGSEIAKKTIKAKNLKAGAVTEPKIANLAVTDAKLGNVVTRFSTTPVPDNSTVVSAHAQCAAGEKLIGGGANFATPGGAGTDTQLIASRPSTDTAGGTPAEGGGFSVWRATAINGAGGPTGPTSVGAWAVCLQ